MGGPHGGKTYIGWWGNMGGPIQKNIAEYTVSPFQQRATAGVLHAAIFNTARRVSGQFLRIAIPFAFGYYIYSYANAKNHWLNTKEGIRFSKEQQRIEDGKAAAKKAAKDKK